MKVTRHLLWVGAIGLFSWVFILQVSSNLSEFKSAHFPIAPTTIVSDITNITITNNPTNNPSNKPSNNITNKPTPINNKNPHPNITNNPANNPSNNSTPKKHTKNNTNTCIDLLSTGHSLAKEFWRQLNRTKEVYPNKLVDPIIIQNISSNSALEGKDDRSIPAVRPFAFCTIPKNGCSRWRRFLRRVQGVKDYYDAAAHRQRDNGLMYPIHFQLLFLQNHTPSPLLRIAIVRDPLSRLLSVWLEKIRGGAGKLNRLNKRCSNYNRIRGNFTEFVLCLEETIETKQQGCGWDEHWSPQSCQCGLSEMRYDLLLRQEQKDDWFQPLIQCLGVERFIFNFTPDGHTFGSSIADQKGGSISMGALSKVCEYYDAVTVAKVSRLYSQDAMFRTWDFSDCRGINDNKNTTSSTTTTTATIDA